MSRPLLLAVLCAAWATPPAPPLVQKKGAATAAVLTPSGQPVLPLSDLATVRLRVEAPAPLKVEVTAEPKATPHWKLQASGPPALRAPKGAGTAVWEQDYVLEPLQPGPQSVELPSLRYYTGDGDGKEIVWKTVTLEITTSVKKAEPASARDITSIEEVPGEAGGGHVLVWAGLGLGVAVLGVAVWLLRRRPAPPPPVPAHEWALRELEGLAARHPQTGAEVEAFHTALSAVLRRYLERRFQIPAERQTTAEFLAAVCRSSDLSAEQQAAVGELLAECDLAKFARVWPSAEECQGLVTRARALVEETAPKPARPVE